MSLFLTFEGLDFSGKSTQVRMLEEHLRSRNATVLVLREPGGTEVGETIRSVLLDPRFQQLSDAGELLLFSASRSELVRTVIRPALAAGTIVVCDRFVDSTVAYQGGGRGIDAAAVRAVNDLATGGLRPHATFFLDIPLEEIDRRREQRGGQRDRMERNDTAFYRRVRDAYLAIARSERRFHVLDGQQPAEQLSARITSIVEGLEVQHHA